VHPDAARLLEPLKLEPIALVILHDDTLAGEAGTGMSRAILLRALLEREACLRYFESGGSLYRSVTGVTGKNRPVPEQVYPMPSVCPRHKSPHVRVCLSRGSVLKRDTVVGQLERGCSQ